ncbi:lysozyme inhibitor LprI family protein [Acidovorax sp. BL-A-41-H1]|uniref:lysozyme inhibitor LprI family protein n=1 Tax=Acidovorax sp. BL-A-41-H1 TaxID=3421102 RepID=UPI003F797E40
MSHRLAALVGTLLVSLAAHAQPEQPPDASTPAFDCQRASKAVERWICTTPALALADQQLSQVYVTAQSKPDDDAALAALRRAQLRWLRERNRCEAPDCVAASYARRTSTLEAGNARVQRVQGQPFEPVFSRTVPNVNDTRAISGIVLQRAQATAYQVELYTDPKDARRWAHGGPGARIACWPPDRQEGYASRFQYAARSWGDAFRKIERDGRQGYVLLRFVVGKDLPLHEDIRCTVALTEWLLDHPSELHVVPVPR